VAQASRDGATEDKVALAGASLANRLALPSPDSSDAWTLRYNEEVNASPFQTPLGDSHVERLRAFLDSEGNNRNWWVRMLLRYGQGFGPWPLPDDIPVMRERCCYLNSFTLATEQPDRLTYVEGYGVFAKADSWGMPHAWCVDRSGHVVDAT
jgi:hypothetical protein